MPHKITEYGSDFYDLDIPVKLTNEAVLPAQFFERGGRISKQPEVELRIAVLELAIRDLNFKARLNTPSAVRGRKEAREWFSGGDSLWLYSFVNICDVIGLNADYARARILSGEPVERLLGGPGSRLFSCKRTAVRYRKKQQREAA